jgi:succinate dehydrogenase / fumarate reductase flavoprotein subunit/L-aspartate oxidase
VYKLLMDDLKSLQKIVQENRESRKGQTFPLLLPKERDILLKQCHPDYRVDAYRPVRIGPNTGEKTVHEVADLLEGQSLLWSASGAAEIKPDPDHTVDVLVIGGGGAGCTAALTAREQGATVLLATKLRVGDANTVMAEGGMQAAIQPEDSPIRHYLDTIRGGHFKNDPQLLKVLVEEGPAAVKWLLELGVLFDRDETGLNLKVRGGGATSTPRLLTCRDYTGLEIMRVLKDALINEEIQILEYSPAVELLSDPEGTCTGAVLKNFDTHQLIVVAAKTVIVATGGSGRLHIQGFPTSNHFGATGDALPLAYRLGAKLRFMDTFQYHPTGVSYPEPMAGILVTEGIRSAGAQLLNVKGDRFINEMDTRDVVAAGIIRECKEGRGIKTPAGRVGVWLDIPMVDLVNGEGTLEKRFPNMMKQFSRYAIDIRTESVLIHPTLHYQNGGVQVNVDGEATVRNLFVAGEASGGLHGRNRLMGNSLLDIIVFGKRAGKAAAQRAQSISQGQLSLTHLQKFQTQLQKVGLVSQIVSPVLIPDYVRREETASSKK